MDVESDKDVKRHQKHKLEILNYVKYFFIRPHFFTLKEPDVGKSESVMK